MVLSTGSALKPGWLHLKRGAVQVDYRSGARVVFEGPAQIRIRSGNRAFCGSGRFRVHVPEQARGFRTAAHRAHGPATEARCCLLRLRILVRSDRAAQADILSEVPLHSRDYGR